MWYIEIVCSNDWISGKIIPANSVASSGKIILLDGENSYSAEVIVYAANNELHGIRFICDTPFDEKLAGKISNYNFSYWKSTIENIIRIDGDSFFNIFSLFPNNVITTYGEGNKESLPLIITPNGVPSKPKINFSALPLFFNAFPRDQTFYMQYFNRFTNLEIPLEMRWLNGYKMFELHFKDRKGLQYNKDWRIFLEEWRDEFSPFLRAPNQKLYGFFESVRNDAAHAVNEINYKEDLISKTLPILQKMLVKLLNILKKTNEMSFASKL